MRPGLASTGIGTVLQADGTGIKAGVPVAAISARVPVRPVEPEPEPEPEPVPEENAARETEEDAEKKRETEGDGSFDTEFALLQLEWPQPIGAIRSEGELAPPPPQLHLTPRWRDRQKEAERLRG